jgi:hypothetical protein
MPVAGDETVGGVPQGSGDETGEDRKPEGAPEVVCCQERRRRSDGDEFFLGAMPGAKPNHGIDRIEFRVSRAEFETVLSSQRCETESAFLLVAQYGLDRRAAETAGVIKEQDRLRGYPDVNHDSLP